MPNQNAAAGLIANIQTASGVPFNAPNAGTQPWRVQFAGDDRVLHLPPEAPRYRRRRLARLYERRRPAYITAVGDQVIEVTEPVVGRLTRVEPPEGGVIKVALDASPRALTVTDTPENQRIVDVLRNAGNRPVMLVASDANAVVDIDLAPEAAWYLAPAFAPAGAEAIDNIEVSQLNSTELEDAWEIVADQDCRTSGAADCIPFDYPVTGCNDRAHAMCLLLEGVGVIAGKLWLFDRRMFAFTKNYDNSCRIGWEFHVVPYVRTSTKPGTLGIRILDPSLFTGPVSFKGFIKALHSSSKKTMFSRAEFYQLDATGGGSRPWPDQMEDRLQEYREEAAKRNPQPPYC